MNGGAQDLGEELGQIELVIAPVASVRAHEKSCRQALARSWSVLHERAAADVREAGVERGLFRNGAKDHCLATNPSKDAATCCLALPPPLLIVPVSADGCHSCVCGQKVKPSLRVGSCLRWRNFGSDLSHR